MKKTVLAALVVVLGILQLTGCAPMRQTWPDLARSTEMRIGETQEKIGDGLQRKVLTIDQSQRFLGTLEGIRNDYLELRGRTVYRGEWDELDHRLDLLDSEIREALERPVTMEGFGYPGDRIIFLQRSIDEGRASGRLTALEVQRFQSGLDLIRRDYLRFTEGGRTLTYEEQMTISRRLDTLETDLRRAL